MFFMCSSTACPCPTVPRGQQGQVLPPSWPGTQFCFGPGLCLSRTQLSLIAGCLETDQSLNFPKPCFHPHPLRTGMQVHLETASPFQVSTFLSWLGISHL